MATYQERATQIAAAFLNAQPTAAQLTRLADAAVANASDAEIQEQFGKAKADLTNAEKAQVVVVTFRRAGLALVRKTAEDDARQTARSAVETAGDNAVAELPEARP